MRKVNGGNPDQNYIFNILGHFFFLMNLGNASPNVMEDLYFGSK